MDFLSFLASVINSVISWPMAIVFLLYVFKPQLAEMLDSITSLNYKGLNISFSKTIEAVARESEEVAPQSPPLPEDAARLADINPAAAILDSWLTFETKLREFASKHDILQSHKQPTWYIAEGLRKKNLWDESTFSVFSELRKLRNDVVHTRSGAITPAQAMEYQLALQRLTTKLTVPN